MSVATEKIWTITKPVMTVVSVMLLLVVFMANENWKTGFRYAKPLALILISILFLLYGLTMQIIKMIFEEKVTFSVILFFCSIIIFMLAIGYLMFGVQGFEQHTTFDTAIALSIAVGIAGVPGYFLIELIEHKI